ncbi:helix-turn-helix domain-containing protein [Pseudomonas gingeri]|uniref:Helix-turn-helix domain-containing protein n=1 Tax=Pseudomonas gingeri TaxID=117681 RepID=A0A7Y7XHY6_9PSED|nr:LexA family transcriptional regulator [Pseudomonas gingeri]NWA27999.1 helix-turn-helix domain-containing protein [Pseudomonas gingeri]NWC00002.1 helix-turn-helix domain-containing protein [Pseudomonas gingeri]
MDKWIALVKAKLEELRLSQEKLGERLDITQGGVGHWLNKRRKPDLVMMNKVLQALGLGHLEVVLLVRDRAVATQAPEEQDEQVYDITSAFRYPVSDWQEVATLQDSARGEYAGRYEVTDHYAPAAFWLQVVGDAMTAPFGTSVPEGMMVLVDPDREVEAGSLVIARLHEGEEAIFRQWMEEAGQPYLKPLNPTWPKIPVDEDCCVIGVVVQATAKF